MLGKQETNTDLFQCVTMEDLVPADHTLRKLKAVLNLDTVVAKVVHLYARIGRPSFDPDVVIRIWVLQYMYGLSERQVCDEIRMHAGFRWFCGMSFNDPVPDQSTLVKLRNNKWAGADIHDELLRETVRACETAGICRPDRLGVDGTQITANAATVSLEEIQPQLSVVTVETPDEPAVSEAPDAPSVPTTLSVDIAETPAEPAVSGAPSEPETPSTLSVEIGGRPAGKHKSGDPDWHGEKFSNATHRSTTDPEARLYRKGANCEAKLRYLGHYMADVTSGVIYGATATQANGTAEREATIVLLDALCEKPRELVADLGYRDGAFLADLIGRGIQPLVPLGDEPLETVPTYKRRTYDLSLLEERRNAQRVAEARNQTRLATRGRRGARAQRQRTRLEHLYAEAKDHHGLGRARVRGLAKVDQQVKLTAAVQNLKRLMKVRPNKREAAVKWAQQGLSLHFNARFRDRSPLRSARWSRGPTRRRRRGSRA